MKHKTSRLLIAIIPIGLACYHATIETGRTPSPQVIEEAFASAWVYGLVPPKTVETASQCPNGVARVETQLTFVNQLVGFLTIGIYTPMHIRVTCAASGSEDAGAYDVPSDADLDALQRIFSEAADAAVEQGHSVLVRF